MVNVKNFDVEYLKSKLKIKNPNISNEELEAEIQKFLTEKSKPQMEKRTKKQIVKDINKILDF